MCEIFGVCSPEEKQINRYLREFYSHSTRHPHGWGLACLDGNEAMIEKEPRKAVKSMYLRDRLQAPIKVSNALAHIRYGTIGSIEYNNCHPYTGKDSAGRRWTLVHNGTIFEYEPLDKYIYEQAGGTDSERILLYVIDRVNELIREKGHPLTVRERCELIDEILINLTEANNKVNLLMFDGECLYVHTNFADSLHYLEKNDAVYFSTKPLSNERWLDVPFTQLLVYRDGEKIFTGTNHGHEYIHHEENMKYINMMYAGL